MSLNSCLQLHPCAIPNSISKFHRRRLSFGLQTQAEFLFTWTTTTSLIGRWKTTSVGALARRPQAIAGYRGGEEHIGTGKGSTMDRIVEKLKKLGYVDEEVASEAKMLAPPRVEKVFYAEDEASSTGLLSDPVEKVRFPWEKDPDDVGDARSPKKKRSHSCLAELTLPERELRRLRLLAIRTKSRIKIGGAGVTKEIVDRIHDKWKIEEIVRLKCEGPPALNMKRMHEILERKTGGLVIWRSGSSISLYRGVTYELPQPMKHQRSYGPGANSLDEVDVKPKENFRWNALRDNSGTLLQQQNYGPRADSMYKVGARPMENFRQNAERVKSETLPEESVPAKKNEDACTYLEMKYEHEIDKLLDGLGPRFTDWPGSDPVPVDADLLPGDISVYNPPFRLLPYGVRRNLTMKDQTILKRTAKELPPHFAVGRSRQLEGLAASMVKLWENSSIAKIAFKRGVQLTTSERMAVELKKLTGGTLLCRNKDYMVFYRGRDFLSSELMEALLERERMAKDLQDEEELARLRASSSLSPNVALEEEPAIAGTLSETLEANSRWGIQLNDDVKNAVLRAAEVERHARLVKKLEGNLSFAERKLRKAEKALGKVEEFLKPTEHNPETESITDEERFMFRKLGLKMQAFLLLGRRGVFDGTVENMHLHWRYRELVKVMVKAKTFAEVTNVALTLEAESGGVLVSVDKVSKGYAIVVYRGKDYRRPTSLRPKNLLTKRKALARSIELQRGESIRRHMNNLERRIQRLKSELEQMETVKECGDEELYAKLDSFYSSQDEESEDEGDEAADCGLDLPSGADNGLTSYVDGQGGHFIEGNEGENDNELDKAI